MFLSLLIFSPTLRRNKKTTKKKTVVATAFLLFLILAFLIPNFLVNSVDACGRHKPPHHKPRPPPLGKSIVIHFVYPDDTPIGTCLEVTLTDLDKSWVAHTDATGTVVFSGLPDETYTWHWSWQGTAYHHSEEITCSKIVWEFTETVDYWTVSKTFFYDTDPPTPVEGLYVKMNGFAGYTDATGTVTFNKVKADEYTLEWVWAGETQSEGIEIGFQTPSPIEMTNLLTPKSGGDK